MKESSPSNSSRDCERKCPLDAYNVLIEKEGGDKMQCQNADCACNQCGKKSCERCSFEDVDKRCFLSIDCVVQDARREACENRLQEERTREVPSEEECEEEAIRRAIDNGETVKEALFHCATEGAGAFVESPELGFDIPVQVSSFEEESFDDEQESSIDEESFNEETDDSSTGPEEQVQDEDGEDLPYNEAYFELFSEACRSSACPSASHMTLKEYMKRRERQRQQEGNDEEENADSDSPNDEYGKFED